MLKRGFIIHTLWLTIKYGGGGEEEGEEGGEEGVIAHSVYPCFPP